MPRRFHASEFAHVEKGAHSTTVVLPARHVEATVGPIVESLLNLGGLVDQVLVVAQDEPSAWAAKSAGAEVRMQDELVPEAGPVLGKGDAMWRSLEAARGDVIAFV